MADRRRTVRVGAVTGVAVLSAGLGLGLTPGTSSALSATTAAAGAVSVARSVSISLPSGFMPADVAVDSDTDTAYVSGFPDGDSTGGDVVVIDLAADSVVATIPDTGGGASSIAVDQDTDTVYTDGIDDSVAVIDGATNTVTTTISLGQLARANARNDIAVDAATDMVYVGARGGGWAVAAIDGQTNAFVNSVPLPDHEVLNGLTVNPATNTVYATSSDYGSYHILVISGDHDAISDTISPRFGAPAEIAVNPDTDVFYVVNATTGESVSAYGGATDAIIGTAAFPGENPLSIAVNTATNAAYVLGTDDLDLGSRIEQINGAGTAVTGGIPVATWGYVAVDSTTDSLVLAESNSTVQVIPLTRPAIGGPDSATFTVGRSESVGLAATGTPAPRVTEQGKLPAGVSLSAAGTLSGTPKSGAGGVYPITIAAANGIGAAATRRFTLTVHQAAAVTSVNHAAFAVGKRGLLTVRTTGFPVATVSEQGALPAGVRFTAEKNGQATISGIPAKSARGKSYVIRFTARNGVGNAVVQRFALRVG
jgi:DNA-binding beta-propeller fold protein YncE